MPWGAWTVLPALALLWYSNFWWTYVRTMNETRNTDGPDPDNPAEGAARLHILSVVNTTTAIFAVLVVLAPIVVWWLTRRGPWWLAPGLAIAGLLAIRLLTAGDLAVIART